MVNFYKLDEDDCYIDCDEAEAEYVMIPLAEYYGYEKAVRIVKDRAIQQVDKSIADKHGYTLMRADKKRYSHEQDEKAWLITRNTPYSIKIGLEEAEYFIMQDLRTHYGYRDLDLPGKTGYSGNNTFTASEMLKLHRQFFIENADRTMIGSKDMLKKLAFLDATEGRLAFEVAGISRNIIAGTYEIRYWATTPR